MLSEFRDQNEMLYPFERVWNLGGVSEYLLLYAGLLQRREYERVKLIKSFVFICFRIVRTVLSVVALNAVPKPVS